MIIYMLFYIRRRKHKKEKFKEKFIKKHMAEPFRFRSESGRIISSFNYEE